MEWFNPVAFEQKQTWKKNHRCQKAKEGFLAPLKIQGIFLVVFEQLKGSSFFFDIKELVL